MAKFPEIQFSNKSYSSKKITPDQFSKVYHTYMKKQENIDAKVNYQRKEKFFKEEMEVRDLNERYHNNIMNEQQAWEVTQKFDRYNAEKQERQSLRIKMKKKYEDEEIEQMFKPNLHRPQKSRERDEYPRENVFQRMERDVQRKSQVRIERQ